MSRYNLAGRTVLITGSTGGLGTALARALRQRGANLALLDLDADRVAAQAADLGPASVAQGWIADVRDLDSLGSAVDAAADHFGRLDVVVAGAGVGSIAPLDSLGPDVWEKVIDINLSGVWRTFRAAIPHIRHHKGYMLAVSSMAAFVHSPLNGAYVASKAGVWALCDATRLEVRHEGIGVGSAHPTFFDTPMMDYTREDPAADALWDGNRGGLWKMIPLDDVVAGIVDGIERRSDLIVIPRGNGLVARAPGIFRPLIERLGFRGTTIPDAIAKVPGTGWIAKS